MFFGARVSTSAENISFNFTAEKFKKIKVILKLAFLCIFSFLKDHQHLPDPTRQYVEWCLENCNHIKAGKISLQSNTIRISNFRFETPVPTFIYLFQFFDEILLPLLKLRP